MTGTDHLRRGEKLSSRGGTGAARRVKQIMSLANAQTLTARLARCSTAAANHLRAPLNCLRSLLPNSTDSRSRGSKKNTGRHVVPAKGGGLVALRTACYISLLGFSFLFEVQYASAQAICNFADPVRFLLNGVEYRIPAALQPIFSPEQALPTRDFFPNGVRAKQ